MLLEGLSLAAITGLGFYFLFVKLPKRVQKFLLRHPLLTDAVACVGTWMILGGSLTAIFAAAWMALITSVMLILMGNETTARSLESIAEKIKSLWDKVIGLIEEKQKPRLELVQ
jgi:hypothetical protein